MKKKMIIGMAMALGLLSTGAVTASAAEPCGNCADSQALRQYRLERDSLNSSLKARESELHGLYAAEGIDMQRADALATEISRIKGDIAAAADRHKIPSCGRV
jgi:hypothetical protein